MDSLLSEAVNYKQILGWGAGGLHIHFSPCWDLVSLDLALDLGYAVMIAVFICTAARLSVQVARVVYSLASIHHLWLF